MSRSDRRKNSGPLRLFIVLWVTAVLAGCGGLAGNRSGGMVSKASQIDAHLKMGAAYLEVGDYNSALAELSKAELLEPDNVDINAYLGLTYFGRGDYPQAVEKYQKVLALDPKKTEAHNNLGLIYMRQREYAKARTEFETCIKDRTYSQVHLAQFNLGLLEESEGHPEAAEKIYHQIISTSQMPSAYYRLGQLALVRDDARMALDFFLPAVRLDPHYTDAFYALAQAYEKLGLNDDAAEAYGQVVNLSPNTARAIEAQNRVRKLLGYQ